MADKSDKGGKKNENMKKNQPDIKMGASDSSTFSYEVPIPGASQDEIRMGVTSDYQSFKNAQSWGQHHVQQSVAQLEQIVRCID